MCEEVASEGFVLGLLSESVLCGLQFLLGECCNLRYSGGHLALLRGLCRRGCARVGVADLRSELGAVHLLEDDLRVLADLSAELLERGFEFDFRHDVIYDLQIYDLRFFVVECSRIFSPDGSGRTRTICA